MAQVGTFRLFRLLTLYPRLEIELRTFRYRDSTPFAREGPSRQDGYRHPVSSLADGDAGTTTTIDGDGVGDVNGVCPPYDAISYTWNPNSDAEPLVPTQQVVVHTSRSTRVPTRPLILTVTSHLIYGLLTAQELCAPTWLFVDAICIDQNDAWDKAIQVQGMDRMFRGAERVFVWLGMDLCPPTPGTGSSTSVGMEGAGHDREHEHSFSSSIATERYTGGCFSRIPALILTLEAYLKHHRQAQNEQQQGQEVTKRNQMSMPMDVAMNIPMASDPVWQDLERLRSNPYFFRLWIIQEVTLSKNTLLLYGRHSLPWPTYAQLTSLCETIITSLSSKQYDAKLVNQLYFAYNSRVSAMTQLQSRLVSIPGHDFYSGGVSVDTVQSLTFLIHNMRKSRASVPIDRIYAIVGLLSNQLREKIGIDYSHDCLNKYWVKWIEFFQAILSLVPEFIEEVFSNATYLERHPKLPSWCPNLADDSQKYGISGPAIKVAGMPNGEPWKTPVTGVGPVKIIPGTTSLRLFGLSIDDVAHVVDLSWIQDRLNWTRLLIDHNTDIDSAVAHDILVTFWQCLDHMRQYNTSLDDGDTVLARCLTAGSYDECTVEPARLVEDYVAFAGYLEHHTWGPASSGRFNRATKSSALRFGDRFQRIAKNRAVFVTREGRVGLGSCGAREGDLLCVLMNCRLPYLLRRCGQEDDGGGGVVYQLIGETYVDSLMLGEAFHGRDMTKGLPEQYIIC